jgi:hypothetical protein
VQLLNPQFWFIVRQWAPPGHSRLVEHGAADSWDELDAIQQRHGVANNAVLIDSGNDTTTVYERCLKHGKLVRMVPAPLFVGWLPAKGREAGVVWRDPKKQVARPIFYGSAPLGHEKFRLPLLEFNGDLLKDILSRLRRGSPRARWEVTEAAAGDPEYWKHLDAEHKVAEYNPRTRRVRNVWHQRSRHWPNHLLDCEVMQIALALFLKLLFLQPYETEPPVVQANAAETSGGADGSAADSSNSAHVAAGH